MYSAFKISSVFSTGLAEFDQNVIFMPFQNANSLFELSELDINLEVFLENPEKVEKIKNDLVKILIACKLSACHNDIHVVYNL